MGLQPNSLQPNAGRQPSRSCSCLGECPQLLCTLLCLPARPPAHRVVLHRVLDVDEADHLERLGQLGGPLERGRWGWAARQAGADV